MASNIRITVPFYDVQCLKYTAGDELAKSVVIDPAGVTFSTDPNVRTVVLAGTILAHASVGSKMCVPYTGSGTIVGVLKRTLNVIAGAATTSYAAEAGAAYWHNAIFATSAIVGFTQYGAALATALPSCRFE